MAEKTPVIDLTDAIKQGVTPIMAKVAIDQIRAACGYDPVWGRETRDMLNTLGLPIYVMQSGRGRHGVSLYTDAGKVAEFIAIADRLSRGEPDEPDAPEEEDSEFQNEALRQIVQELDRHLVRINENLEAISTALHSVITAQTRQFAILEMQGKRLEALTTAWGVEL